MMLTTVHASSQVLLQGFYWDVPVDDVNKKGTWYQHLTDELPYLTSIGISSIWCPPPSKGNWGIYDMGYGIYDHYDLGEYDQIGTVSTRFGTKADLQALMNKAHDLGVELIADVVLNHMYSFQTNSLEPNPFVNHYLLHRKSSQSGYPVNEVRFAITPNLTNEFTITLGNAIQPRAVFGYRLKIDTVPEMTNAHRRVELVVGTLQQPGYIEGVSTMSVIKCHFKNATAPKYWVQLEVLDETMGWSDQTNGLTILSINDKQGKPLEWTACTFTGITPASEKTKWNYRCFHPSADLGLVNYPDTGGIVANSKLFGHDFDHRQPAVVNQLTDWGKWLLNNGYDGVRLDFVNGIDPGFVKSWTTAVTGTNTFCVTEFFTNSVPQITQWNKSVNATGENLVKSFDFPLKKVLTDMCNASGEQFDMRQLIDGGLKHHLPANRIVTFVENHDTGKEHDKWITKNWHLGYAYILFEEAQPTIFYPHLFKVEQMDFHTKKDRVTCDATLPEFIEKCLAVRPLLTGETKAVKNACTSSCYVASRSIAETGKRAYLLINNSANERVIPFSELGITADERWVNALGSDTNTKGASVNKMQVSAFGAALWMPESEYIKTINK